MHASSILAVLGAASLAAAAPQSYTSSEPSEIDVTKFNFGANADGLIYNGQFSVPGRTTKPATCNGRPGPKDAYTPCDPPTSGISALVYSDPATNEFVLYARYKDSLNVAYTGNVTVYSETGDEGAKAKPTFTIPIKRS